MAATTVDRNTPVRGPTQRQIYLPLKSGQDIPAGAIVCVDATGEALNGADTAGLICMGRAAHRATYANGDRFITVERGVFKYANDGNIVAGSRGSLATILDNQTLSLASVTTNDIGAGYIEELEADGVWVSMLGGKVAAT